MVLIVAIVAEPKSGLFGPTLMINGGTTLVGSRPEADLDRQSGLERQADFVHSVAPDTRVAFSGPRDTSARYRLQIFTATRGSPQSNFA